MTRAALATLVALFAFASNSILCRLALRGGSIDPAAFTAIRLASGALVLFLLVAARPRPPKAAARRAWLPALGLTAYAVPFAWAYTDLPAGTGALLLFASVQLTIILTSMARGAPPTVRQGAGIAIAFLGVLWLVLPGVAAPRPASAVLMIAAGMAWGWYTLAGRGSVDPLGQTARNFGWSLPYVLVVCAVAWPRSVPQTSGILAAVASGALASGLGYAIWYDALRSLSAIRAAVVQLAVPVIAAVGGIAFLGERLTPRLAEATILVLGGIALTFVGSGLRKEPSGAPGDSGRYRSLHELESLLAALPRAPAVRGTLRLIVCRLADGSRATPERVLLTPEAGVPGDGWSRRPPRDVEAQVTAVQHDVAVLIANGQPLTLFGDNLFVELDLSEDNLPPGSRVRVGDAVLEVTAKPHDGCVKYRARFGDAAFRFVQARETRRLNLRGVHWRVVAPGAVWVGCPVDVDSRP